MREAVRIMLKGDPLHLKWKPKVCAPKGLVSAVESLSTSEARHPSTPLPDLSQIVRELTSL
jgi:hypothetical protein